ncbi:response regulator transcription factor [Mesoterricola sediminis]|uniref:response regulator transcription factor n=1 Tax=Mesoterricola sediminis TaxID=2927980 RepID=UPI001FB0366F|nr:response regulator transcription factor [Mesoterricola sediminis]
MRHDLSAARVLLIEDDEILAAMVQEVLEGRGLTVTVASHPEVGLALHAVHRADLILLDRMFPGADGLDTLRHLRDKGDAVPIILLTSRGELGDKLEGLGEGADDYMGKPFSVDELEARIRALLRRARPSPALPPDTSVHGPFTIDWAAMRVEREGQVLDLTPQEFRVLSHLIRTPDRPVPRAELLEKAWPPDGRPASPRTVDVYVTRLRSKLGRESDHPWILTLDGEGYSWNG